MKAAAANVLRLKHVMLIPLMLTVVLLSALNSVYYGQNQTPGKTLALTILHTNDIHSHNDSFTEGGRVIGGMPRIAHLIKSIKKSTPNVLAVDAGDIFQGTPYFEQYHGQAEIECLNKSGYDIYTIGNHEFDDGAANLAKQLARAKFDVVNCNLDFGPHTSMSATVKPSVVKVIDGEKVGFVGVITPELNALTTNLDGVKLKATGDKWLAPIKAEVEKLKEQGVNKIVVVSHSGVDYEKALAAAIPDVDVVVGGHSHTRLDKPVIVRHDDGSVSYVVQTGSYTRALGRLDLTFDRDGKLVEPQSKYRLINITDRVFEDPEVKTYVTEMGKPFAYLRTTIVGTAAANFDNRFKNYPFDSPIGDLICDALVEGGSQYGATIALQNRGGIRGKLEQGQITLEKLKEILPFENHLVVATIDGDTLRRALENSVSGILGARFLDVAGLKFAYDPTRESGKRIVFAYAQDKEGKWDELKPEDLYRVALNSYSFGGGEAYDFSKAKDVADTGKRLSVIVQEYLEKVKVVAPKPPSRLLAVVDGKAKIELNAGKPVLTVNMADNPGGDVTIVQGSGTGVEFLPKVGIVPLKDPRVVATGKLSAQGTFACDISKYCQINGKKKQSSSSPWYSAIIRTRNEGAFQRIVTTPQAAAISSDSTVK